MWISFIGKDSLTCEPEDHNENDTNAVAIMWDNFVSNKIIGHVPLNWSKVASKFLQFRNPHIRVDVTGKRVNRGVELGLEIPVNYFLMEIQQL